MRSLQTMLSALALTLAAGAGATTYNTNTPASSTLLAAGAPLYCNSSGCTSTAPGTMTGYATLTAWSTPVLQSSTTISPTDTGTWMTAQLAIYSGGVGISNRVQPVPECFGCAPQHSIDNNGVDDILVVDFGSTGWDVNSFNLGYTANASTGASPASVAVQAWIGGASGVPINFATESFVSANNNDPNANPLIGGFTRLTLNPDPTTGGSVSDSSSVTGRYLIITGALGSSVQGTPTTGYSDAFKVSQIVATRTTVPPSVPIPGSLPLIGLGLLVLRIARRRLAPTA